MTPPIKDRFTKLKVSKQVKYQLRRKAKGQCQKCPEPEEKWGLCRKHVLLADRQRRKRQQCKRRYRCATSALEKMEK